MTGGSDLNEAEEGVGPDEPSGSEVYPLPAKLSVGTGPVERGDGLVLWQEYERGDDRSLVLCARENRFIGGGMRYGGQEWRLSGQSHLALIFVDASGEIRCLADGPCAMEVDGQPVAVGRLVDG